MTLAARALIIDDHAAVREGIKSILTPPKFEYVGEAASKAEGIAAIAHHNPDLIIVDINLPDGSGLEIVNWARSISNQMGIVVLTLSEKDEFLLASMQSGASAYVLKSAPLSELRAALESAVLAPSSFLARGIRQAMDRKSEGLKLTSRELQIIASLSDGDSNSEIAKKLFLSEATIKSHLASIYRKLEVGNRTQAVRRAHELGLLGEK